MYQNYIRAQQGLAAVQSKASWDLSVTASQIGPLALLTTLQELGSGPEMTLMLRHILAMPQQGCSAGSDARLSQEAQPEGPGQGQTAEGPGLGAEQLLHGCGASGEPQQKAVPEKRRGKPLLPAFFTAPVKEPTLDSAS